MDEAPQKYFRAKLYGAETATFSPVNLSTFTVIAIGIPRSHNPVHYSAYGLHPSKNCLARNIQVLQDLALNLAQILQVLL